jgi:hypothetical protein
MKTLTRTFLSLALLALYGCGGGGGAATTTATPTKASFLFHTMSGAHTAPLGYAQLTVQLPAGLSVSKTSCTVTGANSSGQLQYDQDTAFNNGGTNTVTFAVATTGASIAFGPLADVTCDIAPGASLSQAILDSAGMPSVALMGIVGQDAVDLTVAPNALHVAYTATLK